VITLDLFKKSQVEAQANEPDKKSIALKAKTSKEESDDEDDEESDEEMALFVRRFRRMMSKRKFNKKGQSSKKNPFEDRKCYECGEPEHIGINCPSKKNKNYGNKKIEDKKKKYFKKEKNGQAYFVEWDFDESSDGEDDKPSSALAGIAINEAPSLFSKHLCLMAKGESKVTNDEASDDEEDSLSYDDLVRMISESDDVLRKKSDKIMEWKRKYSSLLNSYEELKTSHENLKKSHEELQDSNEFLKESNEKLKEAHITLAAHETVKDKVVTCAKCDELKCTSCCPSTSNFSCSTSISSCTSDASLILENESLKKEVDGLSKDLAKWFGSHAKFNHCWTSKKFTLNRNGIDYEPKKGKSAFIPKKTIFEKSRVRYDEEDKMKTCFICKKKVEAHHMCKNKKTISFDASYMLRKNAHGNVYAKFVGLPISGTKRKSIWVPKALVTNIQGPKQVWVPKQK
jgi:hypothetical protein